MKGIKPYSIRIAILLLVLFLAAPLPARPAAAEDEELLASLPGQWIYTDYTEEQVADAVTPVADLAFLTLEENGRLTLRCLRRDGSYLCSYQGTWKAELVPNAMDRLTLVFSSTDRPGAQSDYSAVCVYNVYGESWTDHDTLHRFLILEEASRTGDSPFADLDAYDPLSLHREQGPNMKVVNCAEYVSLREERSPNAPRLARVPLGALVLAFPEAGNENGFILCSYQDEYGYILAEYLQPVQ